MRKISVLVLIVLLSFADAKLTLAQSVTKDVPISLSVNQTGVNRFIASQWSSIPTSWSGSYQGLSYSITLNRPVVTLLNNEVKIALTLDINTSVYNNEVTIEPSLVTPTLSTATDEIVTSYEDLRSEIDSISVFSDTRLKDIIEDLLEPIDWVIYEGGILDVLSGRIFDSSDLEWQSSTGIDLGVVEGAILLTVTPAIIATSPDYIFRFKRGSISNFQFEIRSNNVITIENVKIYNNGASVGTKNLNATSTFDSGLGLYVASGSMTVTQLPSFMSAFSYKIKLKRQDNETSWDVYLGSIGSTTGWYQRTMSQVTTLVGE